jgi:hypothetical protein
MVASQLHQSCITSTGFSCASQWYETPVPLVQEVDSASKWIPQASRARRWRAGHFLALLPDRTCPKLVTIAGKTMTCRQDNRVALKALRYCDIRMYTLSGYINVLTLQKAILII